MKYMMLIYLDEKNAITEEERQHCYVESTQLAQVHRLHKTIGELLGRSVEVGQQPVALFDVTAAQG